MQNYGKSLLIANSKAFGCIYDIATFIRWKSLDDINTTAEEIFHQVIVPVNELMFQNHKFFNLERPVKRIIFIPTAPLFPRNFRNANQTGAFGLIESYIEAKKSTEVELIVLSHSNGFTDKNNASYYDNVKIFHYENYSRLIELINILDCDYIIQDYFMWNNLTITYNFRHIPQIHLDPGFLPYFYSPVKKIITLPAQKKFGQLIDPNQIKCHYLNRPISNLHNLVDISKRRDFNAKDIRLGSLGRGEKLSPEYIGFINFLLSEIPNSKFYWAGDRAESKIDFLDSNIRDRVVFLPFMKAGDFLCDIDFFIETFPENQGYAVLDALCMECIVMTYDSEGKNANTSERLERMIFKEKSVFLNTLKEFIYNKNARRKVINEQNDLINKFPSHSEYWHNFICSLSG